MTGRTFFRARVAVLLAVLLGVLVWGYLDVRSRHERTTWERPLSIAFVLAQTGSVDPAATRAFCDRLVDLSDLLESEKTRYAPGGGRPFVFQCIGPVAGTTQPPQPDSEGIVAAARQSLALSRYTRPLDDAAGIKKSDFDSRVYVAVRPPSQTDRYFIEGASENGGRIGTVAVDLDPSMVDFALSVATHELFHTLGATDKYDWTGKTMVPEGLAEPDAKPIYPQRFVEVMTRGRPLDESQQTVITNLHELAVGPITAREIGWAK